MRSTWGDKVQRVRQLRDRTAPAEPAHRVSLLERMAENTRPYAVRAGHELAAETIAGAPLTGITSAGERAALAGWVAEMTGWWTATDSLRALDDLTAGLSLEEVLRVCGEEGLHRVAEWEEHGDREVFVASDDGLLGAVFIPAGSARAAPWALRIYFNADVVDQAWFPRPNGGFHRIGDRWLAAGSYGFHLRYSSGSGRSLRVTLAALRASSQILTPWELPVHLSFGPDMPRATTHLTDADHALKETNRLVARALDQLPPALRARFGPLLASPR